MANCSNWEDAKDRLRNYREDQSRKSEEVVELWKEFLSASKHRLGNEEWVLVEQVCIAACDCGDLKVAHECYQILKQQFSGSLRVAYLHGLILEADGCFEKAEELYTDLLKQDETNSLARKRKIALLRAQNRIVESIKELAEYLQRYMSDFEAWLEMCDLYLLEMDYAKAAFCMEELLLANPYNHLLHQKYAEIKYTQGGTDNMEISKKYFAQSLKLNPNNMKSLFGFYMASTHLSQKNIAIKSKKDKNFEYASFAWKNIVNKYQEIVNEEKDESSCEMLSILFKNLQVNPTS